MSRDQIIGITSPGIPRLLSEWKSGVGVELVDDFVPDGVKFRSSVVIGQREVVASLVSVWILGVNSRNSVERLVRVPNVVDQEAHGNAQSVSWVASSHVVL